MRLFFGLELAPALARELTDWRDRQLPSCGRAVPPANFHITLAFVGDLRPPATERLCHSVDDWLNRQAQPGGILSLDQTGYWPKSSIYWLGPTTWPEQLTKLAEKLGSLSCAAGGKRDKRRLQPHITLFRQCVTPPPAPVSKPAMSMTYSHFVLFESLRGKHGVHYHALNAWELQ